MPTGTAIISAFLTLRKRNLEFAKNGLARKKSSWGWSHLIAFRESARPSADLSIWLDMCRGLAAVAVVMGHAHALLFAGTDAQSNVLMHLCILIASFLSSWAHQAVIVFFVMSGYLVGGPFLLKSRQGRANASDYAAARVSRMYTVLLPALVLTLALDMTGLIFFNEQSFINARADFFPHRAHLIEALSPSAFLCNAFFLQEIACRQYGSNLSLWSLSFEGLYYVVWMALVLSPARPAYRFALPFLIAIVFYPYFFPGSRPNAISYGVYFLVWAAGAAASSLTPPGKRTATVGFFVLISIWIGVWKHVGEGFASDLVLAVAFIALIFSIDAWGFGFHLRRKPFRGLANISYSLYAIHLPILVFVLTLLKFHQPQPASLRSLGLFVSLTVLCVAAAAMFWWLFESRTHHVKKWLLRTLRRKDLEPAAAAE